MGNWINESTIIAEDIDGDMSGALQIAATVINNGVIRSTADATLTFGAAMTQGATGKIVADSQTVQLGNSRFVGGTLETANGGLFESTGNSLRLDGVRLAGELHMVNPDSVVGTLGVEGTGFVNDGTIVLSPDAPGASVVFTSTSTISGTGEILMRRGGLGARILSDVGAVGTLGAGQTVRGAGTIGGAIVNNGVIVAEPTDNGVLELQSAPKTNNNVIRAEAGATLRVASATVEQHASAGRLVANGGTIELANAPLNAANVVGGQLQSVGAGTIQVTGAARLDNVVNEGVIHVQPARTLTVGGTSLANNGTITLQVTVAGFAGAGVLLRDGTSLSGTGTLVFTPQLPNKFNSLSVPTGAAATHAAGHTISGEGLINTGGNAGTLINNGRLEGTSAALNFEIAGGTLGGNGLLKNVQINGNASHAPGAPGGTASVPSQGAYTLANNAHLRLDIGGTTAGTNYDQITSTDPAGSIGLNASSILEVSFLNLGNGYIPAAGDAFTILSSLTNIQGDFGTINLPTTGFGRAIGWAPVDRSDPTKYVLRIATVNFLAADFEEDFDVDAADLSRWKLGYGTAVGAVHMQGDADGDADVDGADFLIWQRQLGASASANHAAMPTPEPAAWTLAGAGLLMSWQVRKSRSAGGHTDAKAVGRSQDAT